LTTHFLHTHISQFIIQCFFLISFVVILLLFIKTENDDELAEEMDEVKEKFNTMPYVIVVTTEVFLYDQLSVEQYECGKDGSASVQTQVEQGGGSEPNVHQ